MSSAAVSDTETSSAGRASSVRWWLLTQSATSGWCLPWWSDAATITPSAFDGSASAASFASRRSTSTPSARSTSATRAAIFAVWPWLLP